jgi:hypothetical protein
MARKGDIDSKGIASRVPMDVYIRLLTKATSEKKTISSFLCEILSNKDLTLSTDKLKSQNEQLLLIITGLTKILFRPSVRKIVEESEVEEIFKMDRDLLIKILRAFKDSGKN